MSDERVNGLIAVPTPVASGLSPVTPGDMAYVVLRLRELPTDRLRHLALGSLLGSDNCGVCAVLRERPGDYAVGEGEVANAILEWHGNDALRCGVIYGAACALTLGKAERR